MDKLGAHFFWGYSSALDLLKVAAAAKGQHEQNKETGEGLWAIQVKSETHDDDDEE